MGIKVIYILGYGRSGSTLMDAVLGVHPQVFNVGELVQLHREGWINNHYCSCGKQGRDCSFWSAVYNAWIKSTNNYDITKYVTEQENISHPITVFGRAYVKQQEEFLNATYLLYKCISEISGSKIIIDSSKLPSWAMVLSQIKEIDLRVIHLIRDGRGVAYSLSKSYKKDVVKGIPADIHNTPVWKTSLKWLVYNFLSELFLLQANSPWLRVYYEDFVSEPVKAISRIGNFVELDYKFINKEFLEGGIKPGNHIISGNRLRLKEYIKIMPDNEWKKHLTKWERISFWFFGGLANLRYGYFL